ncbi:uncharacterized protein JN550_005589 [Neoarthrinium moseri]|uniref:uncharacterized protein n=1 Tax=Neoarthrinium moseri TaxID=1658444 RepID=UPI001FDB99E3|nr:uncharacterized protein JN550_005589 [Neoarthrinium moseri]KAI1869999.1 hypothetical protein JN550_005589 [Neoarthrinium moseri]
MAQPAGGSTGERNEELGPGGGQWQRRNSAVHNLGTARAEGAAWVLGCSGALRFAPCSPLPARFCAASGTCVSSVAGPLATCQPAPNHPITQSRSTLRPPNRTIPVASKLEES